VVGSDGRAPASLLQKQGRMAPDLDEFRVDAALPCYQSSGRRDEVPAGLGSVKGQVD